MQPMKNEEITFCITPETSIFEFAGIETGARLVFQASGLDIYVVGSDPDKHPDCIPNLAMAACIARHIPLSSLHGVGTVSARSIRQKTETKEMF